MNPMTISTTMKCTVLSVTLVSVLLGCQAAEEKAASLQGEAEQAVKQKVEEGKKVAGKAIDDKLDEAKQAATKAIKEKIDASIADAGKAAQKAQADIMKGLNPDQAYEAEKGHAAAMAEHVQKATKVDAHTKEWIEKTLSSTSQAVQSLAIPTMQNVYAKFPEHRAWLESQVKGIIKSSEGPIKVAWEDILTNWERIRTVAESQR